MTKLNRLNQSPKKLNERKERHAETVRKYWLKKKASRGTQRDIEKSSI